MTFTPNVTPMHSVAQGGLGNAAFQVPGWIDVLQSTSTAASYNVATARSNMGLSSKEALFVEIQADGPTYFNMNATAVVPAANKTDGSASEFTNQYKPNPRYLLDQSITAISIVSASAQNVTLKFYRP